MILKRLAISKKRPKKVDREPVMTNQLVNVGTGIPKIAVKKLAVETK